MQMWIIVLANFIRTPSLNLFSFIFSFHLFHLGPQRVAWIYLGERPACVLNASFDVALVVSQVVGHTRNMSSLGLEGQSIYQRRAAKFSSARR
jgi:hypothetical protein